MKIFKDKDRLSHEISGLKNLSFIPTMGSFHKGHEFLIKQAKNKKKKVIVSIFVNPKQFDSKRDFKNYPRTFKKDLKILRRLKVPLVYMPSFKDVYSFTPKNKIFLDIFSKKLCGKFRGVHFKGVLNIVNRFLEIIKPKYIYLGIKDFQQLYLIKKHIKKRRIDTKVVPCKIIREKKGYAFSSRNKNLTIKDKLVACKVYNFLKKLKIKLKRNKLKKFDFFHIKKSLIKLGVSKIDYIELVNTKNPKKKRNVSNFNIFIAYYLSNIRLIDNI
jgi:pantoate--beta-alanine ligase